MIQRKIADINMKKIWIVLSLLASVIFAACDDNTESMGIYPDEDYIITDVATVPFTTSSVELGAVVANSSKSYLGRVHDPETNTDVKAEFLAQFHTSENYTLPDVSLLVKNDAGQIECDSVEVRLYYSKYYGDSSNPIKVNVYELDMNNVLREDQTYYSDLDLASYVPTGAEPLVTKVFTASDFSLSESERSSANHYDNVRIVMPRDFGNRILRAAAEHPEYFKDSWQFMHHVFPGLYFQLQSGTGTMLTLDVSSLNVYFRYRSTTSSDVYDGLMRFAATAEVIQSTKITNSNLSALLTNDVPYTYLKSPAGVATEITLPIDDIFKGHELDSINRARVVLTRYNSASQNEYSFDTPSTLLMVRKGELASFFDNREVADNKTSYITSFDTGYNTYSFSNIARLLSYLYREKQDGMLNEGLTSAQWNAAHPDWNKVVVTPVVVNSTTNQSTGVTRYVSVTHDFSLGSVRLVGGTQPQEMQVIYSRYK